MTEPATPRSETSLERVSYTNCLPSAETVNFLVTQAVGYSFMLLSMYSIGQTFFTAFTISFTAALAPYSISVISVIAGCILLNLAELTASEEDHRVSYHKEPQSPREVRPPVSHEPPPSSNVSVVERICKSQPIGLRNGSNVCWANAFFQAVVFHLPLVREGFLNEAQELIDSLKELPQEPSLENLHLYFVSDIEGKITSLDENKRGQFITSLLKELRKIKNDLPGKSNNEKFSSLSRFFSRLSARGNSALLSVPGLELKQRLQIFDKISESLTLMVVAPMLELYKQDMETEVAVSRVHCQIFREFIGANSENSFEDATELLTHLIEPISQLRVTNFETRTYGNKIIYPNREARSAITQLRSQGKNYVPSNVIRDEDQEVVPQEPQSVVETSSFGFLTLAMSPFFESPDSNMENLWSDMLERYFNRNGEQGEYNQRVVAGNSWGKTVNFPLEKISQRLSSPPPYLFLSINRYRNSGRKIYDPIHVPPSFGLNGEWVSAYQNQEYRIVSSIVHQGIHYVSYTRHEEDDKIIYFKEDDEQIREISGEEFLKAASRAYLIIAERVTTD